MSGIERGRQSAAGGPAEDHGGALSRRDRLPGDRRGAAHLRPVGRGGQPAGPGPDRTGIGHGDRVAIRLAAANALRWVIAYAAIHKAGGVAVPLDPRLAQAEVDRMFVHAHVVAWWPTATGRVGAGHRSGREHGSPLELVIDASLDGTGRRSGRRTTPSAARPVVSRGTETLDDDGSAYQVPVDDDDLADIMFTSGTTGHPKGVAVRHVNASTVPNSRTHVGRGPVAPRQPVDHLRRSGLRLRPDEAGDDLRVPAPVRRRRVVGLRRVRRPPSGVPGAVDGPAAPRPPRDSSTPTSPR